VYPGEEEIGVNCRSPKAKTRFTSASVTNLFAIQMLLEGSKEIEIIKSRSANWTADWLGGYAGMLRTMLHDVPAGAQ